MENPEIPGRIQIERFIPVEIFWKNIIPFEVSTVSRFTETTEFFTSRIISSYTQFILM